MQKERKKTKRPRTESRIAESVYQTNILSLGQYVQYVQIQVRSEMDSGCIRRARAHLLVHDLDHSYSRGTRRGFALSVRARARLGFVGELAQNLRRLGNQLQK